MLGNIISMAICLGSNPFNADIRFKMQMSLVFLNRDICILNTDFALCTRVS